MNGERSPSWVGLKFFNVYGPNEYHKGEMQSVVSKMWRQIRSNKCVKLFKSYHPDYADGGQIRDFIWVDDCIAVMKFFLTNPGISGLFNVGTGDPRSFADLARATFAAGGIDDRIDYIDMAEALRGRYQYFTRASVNRLRQAGYAAPFTPMEAGVRAYVQNYLALDDPYR
jgi:ADP-L-glycero-D-manno-heptose 6-epimerase